MAGKPKAAPKRRGNAGGSAPKAAPLSDVALAGKKLEDKVALLRGPLNLFAVDVHGPVLIAQFLISIFNNIFTTADFSPRCRTEEGNQPSELPEPGLGGV